MDTKENITAKLTAKDDKYACAFADKIIGALNEYPISEHELIDAHFFYQETAESYYKQRNERVDAIELSITYCNLDIELFPKYSKKLIEEFGMIPNITTFKRLAIIYENQNKYDLAIDICKKLVLWNELIQCKRHCVFLLRKFAYKLY